MANPPANRYIPGQPPSDLSPYNLSQFLLALQKGLQAESKIKFPAQTTSFNVGSEYLYAVDATAGNVTVTLPPAVSSVYKGYCIKKTDASANTVIVTPSGSDTIDGAATKTLTNQWNWICLRSDGVSSWYVETSLIGSGSSSPLNTKGDIWSFTTVDARVGVSGTNGAIPVEDSTKTAGWSWTLANTLTAGSMILLGSATASGSPATLALTSMMTSGYDEYIIQGEDFVNATNTKPLAFQVSTDNGATWQTTQVYWWGGAAVQSASTATNFSSGATGYSTVWLTRPADNTSPQAQTFTLVLRGCNSTLWKTFNIQSSYWTGSTVAEETVIGGGIKLTTAINAIRICYDTNVGTGGSGGSNITTGTVRIYGISKSNTQMMMQPGTSVTTAGAFSVNVPTGVTVARIRAVGAGGSGGGGTAAAGAGGGGGAGEVIDAIVPVTSGGTLSGVVGAGGIAVSGATPGNVGGVTTITGTGINMSAAGGLGGGQTNGNGGAGGGTGGGAGGSAGAPGAAGTAGAAETQMCVGGSGGGGPGTKAGNNNGGVGGKPPGANATSSGGVAANLNAGGGGGGSTIYGAGGNGGAGNNATPANSTGATPATGAYGAGGGGAGQNAGGATTSGAGQIGAVFIQWL